MKFYKVTLKQNSGSTKLIYPNRYQEEVGDYAKDHLYYEDEKGLPMLLLAIEDKNATGIVRDNIEQITEQEAINISEENEIREEVITNEAKIRRIEIKARIGQELTEDELKAIDPDDDTPGIQKRKIFTDRLPKLKTKEKNKKIK